MPCVWVLKPYEGFMQPIVSLDHDIKKVSDTMLQMGIAMRCIEAPTFPTADELSLPVLHGESSQRLAQPRNTKNREHQQSAQMTANGQNSQTKHQAPSKGQSYNTNQQSSRAHLQHGSPPPSLCKPSRIIVRSSQPTQPNAKHRRADSHYHTDTVRISGKRGAPRLGGPRSGGTDGQPRRYGQPLGRGRGERGGG